MQRGTSVLPRSLLIERIKANYDILNWSLSKDDWIKINNIEPQIRLIDGSHAFVDHDQLQSVIEIDDAIDESGYEPEDETGYDGPELETEDADEIEKFQATNDIENNKPLNVILNLREMHEGSNIVNVELKIEDGNHEIVDIAKDENVNTFNDQNVEFS